MNDRTTIHITRKSVTRDKISHRYWGEVVQDGAIVDRVYSDWIVTLRWKAKRGIKLRARAQRRNRSDWVEPIR